MRLLVAVEILLLTVHVSARVVPGAESGLLYLNSVFNASTPETSPLGSTGSVTTTADNADPWTLSVARGTKLLNGMKSSDASAATLYGMGTTAESPFDGDLISKLREWGYNDNTPAMQKLHDPECNMNSASGHMLSKAFLDLGLDTKSKNNGGPNQCFQIEHFDGPTVIKDPDGSVPPKSSQYYEVCKAQYRVTGAEHTIGVNAAGGAVFAISLSSAAKSARRLWRVAPQTEKLPHIRSVSDISWAFWHRAVAETEGADLKNIRYFFVNMVTNTETSRHIKRALQSLTPPHEDPIGWSGHEFSMETDAGKALLGSPVGRWVGYFLMQHKRQLGGNKFISKVRVFKSQKEGSLPYLLFYVDGQIVALISSSQSDSGVAVVQRTEKKIVRKRNVSKKQTLRGKL